MEVDASIATLTMSDLSKSFEQDGDVVMSAVPDAAAVGSAAIVAEESKQAQDVESAYSDAFELQDLVNEFLAYTDNTTIDEETKTEIPTLISGTVAAITEIKKLWEQINEQADATHPSQDEFSASVLRLAQENKLVERIWSVIENYLDGDRTLFLLTRSIRRSLGFPLHFHLQFALGQVENQDMKKLANDHPLRASQLSTLKQWWTVVQELRKSKSRLLWYRGATQWPGEKSRFGFAIMVNRNVQPGTPSAADAWEPHLELTVSIPRSKGESKAVTAEWKISERQAGSFKGQLANQFLSLGSSLYSLMLLRDRAGPKRRLGEEEQEKQNLATTPAASLTIQQLPFSKRQRHEASKNVLAVAVRQFNDLAADPSWQFKAKATGGEYGVSWEEIEAVMKQLDLLNTQAEMEREAAALMPGQLPSAIMPAGRLSLPKIRATYADDLLKPLNQSEQEEMQTQQQVPQLPSVTSVLVDLLVKDATAEVRQGFSAVPAGTERTMRVMTNDLLMTINMWGQTALETLRVRLAEADQKTGRLKLCFSVVPGKDVGAEGSAIEQQAAQKRLNAYAAQPLEIQGISPIGESSVRPTLWYRSEVGKYLLHTLYRNWRRAEYTPFILYQPGQDVWIELVEGTLAALKLAVLQRPTSVLAALSGLEAVASAARAAGATCERPIVTARPSRLVQLQGVTLPTIPEGPSPKPKSKPKPKPAAGEGKKSKTAKKQQSATADPGSREKLQVSLPDGSPYESKTQAGTLERDPAIFELVTVVFDGNVWVEFHQIVRMLLGSSQIKLQYRVEKGEMRDVDSTMKEEWKAFWVALTKAMRFAIKNHYDQHASHLHNLSQPKGEVKSTQGGKRTSLHMTHAVLKPIADELLLKSGKKPGKVTKFYFELDKTALEFAMTELETQEVKILEPAESKETQRLGVFHRNGMDVPPGPLQHLAAKEEEQEEEQQEEEAPEESKEPKKGKKSKKSSKKGKRKKKGKRSTSETGGVIKPPEPLAGLAEPAEPVVRADRSVNVLVAGMAFLNDQELKKAEDAQAAGTVTASVRDTRRLAVLQGHEPSYRLITTNNEISKEQCFPNWHINANWGRRGARTVHDELLGFQEQEQLDPVELVFMEYVRMPGAYLNAYIPFIQEMLPELLSLGVITEETRIYMPNTPALLGALQTASDSGRLGGATFTPIEAHDYPLYYATSHVVPERLGTDHDANLKQLDAEFPFVVVQLNRPLAEEKGKTSKPRKRKSPRKVETKEQEEELPPAEGEEEEPLQRPRKRQRTEDMKRAIDDIAHTEPTPDSLLQTAMDTSSDAIDALAAAPSEGEETPSVAVPSVTAAIQQSISARAKRAAKRAGEEEEKESEGKKAKTSKRKAAELAGEAISSASKADQEENTERKSKRQRFDEEAQHRAQIQNALRLRQLASGGASSSASSSSSSSSAQVAADVVSRATLAAAQQSRIKDPEQGQGWRAWVPARQEDKQPDILSPTSGNLFVAAEMRKRGLSLDLFQAIMAADVAFTNTHCGTKVDVAIEAQYVQQQQQQQQPPVTDVLVTSTCGQVLVAYATPSGTSELHVRPRIQTWQNLLAGGPLLKHNAGFRAAMQHLYGSTVEDVLPVEIHLLGDRSTDLSGTTGTTWLSLDSVLMLCGYANTETVPGDALRGVTRLMVLYLALSLWKYTLVQELNVAESDAKALAKRVMAALPAIQKEWAATWQQEADQVDAFVKHDAKAQQEQVRNGTWQPLQGVTYREAESKGEELAETREVVRRYLRHMRFYRGRWFVSQASAMYVCQLLVRDLPKDMINSQELASGNKESQVSVKSENLVRQYVRGSKTKPWLTQVAQELREALDVNGATLRRINDYTELFAAPDSRPADRLFVLPGNLRPLSDMFRRAALDAKKLQQSRGDPGLRVVTRMLPARSMREDQPFVYDLSVYPIRMALLTKPLDPKDEDKTPAMINLWDLLFAVCPRVLPLQAMEWNPENEELGDELDRLLQVIMDEGDRKRFTGGSGDPIWLQRGAFDAENLGILVQNKGSAAVQQAVAAGVAAPLRLELVEHSSIYVTIDALGEFLDALAGSMYEDKVNTGPRIKDSRLADEVGRLQAIRSRVETMSDPDPEIKADVFMGFLFDTPTDIKTARDPQTGDPDTWPEIMDAEGNAQVYKRGAETLEQLQTRWNSQNGIYWTAVMQRLRAELRKEVQPESKAEAAAPAAPAAPFLGLGIPILIVPQLPQVPEQGPTAMELDKPVAPGTGLLLPTFVLPTIPDDPSQEPVPAAGTDAAAIAVALLGADLATSAPAEPQEPQELQQQQQQQQQQQELQFKEDEPMPQASQPLLLTYVPSALQEAPVLEPSVPANVPAAMDTSP